VPLRFAHHALAQEGLTSLPHECGETGCPGGFRWQALQELIQAARYALASARLPDEIQTMLHGSIHKLDTLKYTESDAK